jgi:hypothetical protein
MLPAIALIVVLIIIIIIIAVRIKQSERLCTPCLAKAANRAGGFIQPYTLGDLERLNSDVNIEKLTQNNPNSNIKIGFESTIPQPANYIDITGLWRKQWMKPGLHMTIPASNQYATIETLPVDQSIIVKLFNGSEETGKYILTKKSVNEYADDKHTLKISLFVDSANEMTIIVKPETGESTTNKFTRASPRETQSFN